MGQAALNTMVEDYLANIRHYKSLGFIHLRKLQRECRTFLNYECNKKEKKEEEPKEVFELANQIFKMYKTVVSQLITLEPYDAM